jgi:hypothetical protein
MATLPDDFDYEVAVTVRDAWQAILDRKFEEASKLQWQINDINDQIEQYEQEQRVLDE